MPSNTTYTITSNDEVLGTKSSKASAVKFADEFADENRGQTVTVATGSGKQVHTVTRKPAGSHASPWTRVDSSDKIELTAPAGFTVAYVRSRIGALVCRANDKSGWIVVTADETFEAKDTIEAREITNDLAAKHKVARAAELEQAKADRKAEKERKAQEKADAKAAADAEKEKAAEAAA